MRVIEVGNIVYAPAICSARRSPPRRNTCSRATCSRRSATAATNGNATRSMRRRAAPRERFGFTFEGIFRQHMIVKGRNRDTAWYSMLDSEWPARKRAFERWLAPDEFRRQRPAEGGVEQLECGGDEDVTKPGDRIEGENRMAGRLKDKVALVTAGGQGIGRAIAEGFIAEGAVVIATDLDPASSRASRPPNPPARCAIDRRGERDLPRRSARTSACSTYLPICAGYVHHGTVLDCSEADWDFSFDLNVKSMHRTITAFLPGMLKKGRRLDRQHRRRRSPRSAACRTATSTARPRPR